MYVNKERSLKTKSKPVKSLFKSKIIKTFSSNNMTRADKLQLVYAYLESLIIPDVLQKPLKSSCKSVLGFFVAKLLDLIGPADGDFTGIERTAVEEFQKHLLKGESVEDFFEESPNNITIWRNILSRRDVANHFYHDLTDSELDTSSSPGSLPDPSTPKRPKMSNDQESSTPASSSDPNPATSRTGE